MRPRLTLLCLFLVAVLPASAQSSHWLQVNTDHFIVITDTSDHEARHIAAQFERMRGLFNTILPHGVGGDSAPITVLAVKNKKEFSSLEPTDYLAKNSLQLAGLFLRTPGRNYILLRLDAEGEHPFATVYHEYTHYMTRRAEWLPLWLSEGLAEFYENTDIADKEVRLGQASANDIYFLRDNKLIPLSTLFAVDHSSPYYHDEQKGSIFYAESWALVHYLEVEDARQKTNRIHDYAQYLSQHQDPVEAAQHAFGNLDQLQKALNNYVSQMSFSYFKVNSAVSINEASLTVVPVSAVAADATRADVLAFNGRDSEAKTVAEGILKDDPQSLLAKEAMGDVCYVKQDRPCALKWYEEAVKLGSQNPFVLFNYSSMLLEGGDEANNSEIEADLKKSIHLDGSFAPAYDMLARYYATRTKSEVDMRIATLHAISLEPEQFGYRMNAASDWVAMNEPENAIAILETAKKVFHSATEQGVLDARIQQLKAFQAVPAERRTVSINSTEESTPGSHVKVIHEGDGKTVTLVTEPDEAPTPFPAASNGTKHTFNGVIHEVECRYPTVLTLSLVGPKQSLKFYSNNYYKIPFSTLNFQPEGDLDVCHQLDGMKARIEYGEVSDSRVAGQILSVEISR